MNEKVKIVVIQREIKDGSWKRLVIYVESTSGNMYHFARSKHSGNKDENEAVRRVINTFEQDFGLSFTTLKILEGFQKLKEENLEGLSSKLLDIDDGQTNGTQHFSCKLNNNENFGENEVRQSDINKKLAVLDQQSETVKFFQDNKCSICLSEYKEILDENLHIVVPSCGHPLCCSCADNIMITKSKNCPQCVRSFTLQSFKLMKFNGDLEVNLQDQRVFL